ncbi:LLM class flavin-dependent oxidoreductase [uncultured Jatrophihabitans sp.]|uniref:LLM class flavin-dependent oxidoreductase n=1 Tax=uncultured Jatrophihabitans sp. TaxID=1610747 RepID=UPI0035CC88B3
MPCRVGVQLPEVERSVPWPEVVAMAQAAEQAGLDSIWLGDHLLYDLPDGTSRGPWEVWTALAALASVTERVQLGPFVASTSFHPPPVLAKQAATVDAISGGRLVLGLGAGWNQREYTAYGLPYDRRVSRFEEAFTVIRELVRTGHSTFHGTFYDVEDCVLDPRPLQPGGPPIMLGSVGPRMLRIGLPHVDAWNVWWSDYGNTVDGFTAVRERVEAAAREAGRGPGEVEATAAVFVQLPGGVGRLAGEPYDEHTPGPVPVSELAAHLDAMSRAGAAHLQLVLDPITVESVEIVGEVVRSFRAGA